MTNYRRNFLAGGCFFFTVNLEDRRLRLLTQHIGLLRQAFRYGRRHHPFAIDAIIILPDHLHAIWTLPEGDADFAMRGGSSNRNFRVACAAVSAFQPVAPPNTSAVSGKGAIGSIRCAMRKILRATPITFISIR